MTKFYVVLCSVFYKLVKSRNDHVENWGETVGVTFALENHVNYEHLNPAPIYQSQSVTKSIARLLSSI